MIHPRRDPVKGLTTLAIYCRDVSSLFRNICLLTRAARCSHFLPDVTILLLTETGELLLYRRRWRS
jgi:hypothetical protein